MDVSCSNISFGSKFTIGWISPAKQNKLKECLTNAAPKTTPVKIEDRGDSVVINVPDSLVEKVWGCLGESGLSGRCTHKSSK